MYEFQLEQQAEQTKKKIFLIGYVLSLAAAIVIGFALRLQHIQTTYRRTTESRGLDQQPCQFCITEKIDFNRQPSVTPTEAFTPTPSLQYTPTQTPVQTTAPTPSPTATTPTGSPTATPSQYISLSADIWAKDCVTPNEIFNIEVQVTNHGNMSAHLLETDISLPPGTNYVADSASVDGHKLTADNITIQSAGNAEMIKLRMPNSFSEIEMGKTRYIRIKAKVNNAKEGKQTLLAVVVPYEGQALDNITFQFEVAKSCAAKVPLPTPLNRGTPQTGLLDEVILPIFLGLILIMAGVRLTSSGRLLSLMHEVYSSTLQLGYKIGVKSSSRSDFEYKVSKKDSSPH